MKTIEKQSLKYFELIFISLFWVLLFISPLLFQWINKATINWSVIFNVWVDYLPLLIIFIINRGILIPKVLFKSRLTLYLVFVVLLISFTVLGTVSIRSQLNPQRTAPKHEAALLQFSNSNNASNQRNQREQRDRRNFRKQEPQKADTPPYINLILLSILLVGFDTGMKISVNWAHTSQQKAEIEKENIKNELAFLRNQINPHFLMNTLNNIHSLVDFDTKTAKSSIAKLSVLMRYVLYESSEKPTTLVKEINFIESYIKLMELRYSEEVEIKFERPIDIPNTSIHPLLFTNILENAFKYGISPDEKSFVHISLLIHENEIEFSTLNSLHQKQDEIEQSGIGIKNTEKRLKLLYNNNYTFAYNENENVYRSTIKIPI